MEWGIEARGKFGVILAHRGVMGHLPESPASAIELSLFTNTKGKKYWQHHTAYPTLGVTLFAGNVGNKQILGNFFGAYGFVEFPLIKAKFYRFYAKLGSGLGVGTKVYDPIKNPKNVAMGTHLNALICLGFKSQFSFNKNAITLGIDMTHFSNAAFKTPNLGINLPFLSLGYSRLINEVKQIEKEQLTVDFPYKRWLYNVMGVLSAKEVYPTGGKKYPVYAFQASVRRFFKPKVGMEYGFDVFSKQMILDYHPEIKKNQWDILQIGVFAAYLLPLDHFHFVFGMGAYLKDKYQPEEPFYHRVGMRYYFDNGLNINLCLKSHWAKADYAELGLGYSFNYRKK